MEGTRSGGPLMEHLLPSCLPWQCHARAWHPHPPMPSVPAAATCPACGERIGCKPVLHVFQSDLYHVKCDETKATAPLLRHMMCCWLLPYVSLLSCCAPTGRTDGSLCNSLCRCTIIPSLGKHSESSKWGSTWLHSHGLINTTLPAQGEAAFMLTLACMWAGEWHESMSSCYDLVWCVLTQSRIKDFFSRESTQFQSSAAAER